MLLVLFAVVIAAVLSVTFLSAQGTTHGISLNIQHHTRARFIAESASQMILRHLKTNANWRDDFSEGVWISDQPLAGGSFTIIGEDGVFNADTNEVDGDGNLGDDPSDPATITIIGKYQDRTHRVRLAIHVAVQPGEGGGGGSPHGSNVADSITLTGSARIDAVNSATTTYNPGGNSNVAASVATNTTGSKKISLSGSATIVGHVHVGVGGSTATVITSSGSSKITGEKNVLPTPITIPAIATPPDLPSSSGNSSFPSYGDGAINAGTYRYNNFTVGGSHTITINGNVLIYCDGTFKIEGSGAVKFAAGATLTVYANKIEVKGSGKINTNLSPPLPARLTMYQTGNANVTIEGSGMLYGSIAAPDAKLVVSGSGKHFGNFFGNAIEITGSGRFTQDLALIEGGGVSGGGGAGSGDTAVMTVKWTE